MSRNTPRLTRSRNQTPLPSLPTKKSHAYGASGKASLQEQMASTQDELGAAFQSTRSTRGSTRAPSQESMAPPARRTRQAKPTPTPVVQEEDEEDDDDENIDVNLPTANGTNAFTANQTFSQINGDSDDRPSTSRTDMQNSAMYDASRPVPRPVKATRPSVKAPARPPPPPASAPRDRDFTPASFRVFLHTVPRYLSSLLNGANNRAKGRWKTFSDLFLLAIMVVLVAIAALAVPLPSGLQHVRERVLYRFVLMGGVPGVDPYEWERKWHAFTHDKIYLEMLPNVTMPDLQYAINYNFQLQQDRLRSQFESQQDQIQTQFDGVNNETYIIKQQLALHDAAMSEFERILPKLIVTTQENGQWTVPPLFWKALVQKMSSDEAAPLWSQFLEANEQRLHAFNKQSIDSHLADVAETHHLVKQSDFQAALIENNKFIQEVMGEELRSFHRQVLNEARATAKEYLEQSEIMTFARSHISALGHANLVYNTDKALYEVNYFAAGQNALVDPHYTTPTRVPSRGWFYSTMSLFGFVRHYPYPAAAALRGWEETSDCWCSESTPDNKIKAQLGVKLGWKIFPTELTIEHVPAQATRDISAAPKAFELWVQVANASEAKRITKALAGAPHYGGAHCKSRGPNGGKGWVCVVADEYNIHNHNYVQTFPIGPDAISLGMATERVALRVLENWGNPDHTCLYRVRMTGKEVGVGAQ